MTAHAHEAHPCEARGQQKVCPRKFGPVDERLCKVKHKFRELQLEAQRAACSGHSTRLWHLHSQQCVHARAAPRRGYAHCSALQRTILPVGKEHVGEEEVAQRADREGRRVVYRSQRAHACEADNQPVQALPGARAAA